MSDNAMSESSHGRPPADDWSAGSVAAWLAAHARVRRKRHQGIKLDDTLALFQQLSTLISAGNPLVAALALATDETESIKLASILQEILYRIEAGDSFHQAVASYPEVCPNECVQLIRIGELSGSLPAALLRITAHVQKARETRKKVIGALIYPAIMIVVSLAGVVVMLGVVVPKFAEFFADMGSQLPEITQFTLAASKLIEEHLVSGTVSFAGLAFGGWFALRRTMPGRQLSDAFILTVPVLGELVVQSTMQRFARNLAVLLQSGTPLLEALSVLEDMFLDSTVYQPALAATHDGVSRGESLASTLEQTGLFTPMLMSMVRVGEESGGLPQVLEQIADYYEEKAEGLVRRITSLVEPAIILGMGGLVAFLLASIYLPMFSLSSVKAGN